MKNIHVLPTDKPSKLYIRTDVTPNFYSNFQGKPHNIYITSDEEIKNGDWYFDENKLKVKRYFEKREAYPSLIHRFKIILTTDDRLIKDGVQAIDDEFLEWFVKNPSCEFIRVGLEIWNDGNHNPIIIIPKEEPKTGSITECIKMIIDNQLNELEELKQETLEEVNWKVLGTKNDTFYNGAKWQQEQDKNKYSEEEVEIIIQELMNDVHCGDLCYGDNVIDFKLSPRQWFQKFKNK
jgi:hypothetical protein